MGDVAYRTRCSLLPCPRPIRPFLRRHSKGCCVPVLQLVSRNAADCKAPACCELGGRIGTNRHKNNSLAQKIETMLGFLIKNSYKRCAGQMRVHRLLMSQERGWGAIEMRSSLTMGFIILLAVIFVGIDPLNLLVGNAPNLAGQR